MVDPLRTQLRCCQQQRHRARGRFVLRRKPLQEERAPQANYMFEGRTEPLALPWLVGVQCVTPCSAVHAAVHSP